MNHTANQAPFCLQIAGGIHRNNFAVLGRTAVSFIAYLLFVHVILTTLIGYAAGSLASRLARCLACAASAVFCSVHQFACA